MYRQQYVARDAVGAVAVLADAVVGDFHSVRCTVVVVIWIFGIAQLLPSERRGALRQTRHDAEGFAAPSRGA